MLVVGIALEFLGAFVLYEVPALMSAYYVAKDGPGAVVNSLPVIIVGVATSLIGLIFLLIGVSRAAAGIDYLVKIARDPSGVGQRRAREDSFSRD